MSGSTTGFGQMLLRPLPLTRPLPSWEATGATVRGGASVPILPQVISAARTGTAEKSANLPALVSRMPKIQPSQPALTTSAVQRVAKTLPITRVPAKPVRTRRRRGVYSMTLDIVRYPRLPERYCGTDHFCDDVARHGIFCAPWMDPRSCIGPEMPLPGFEPGPEYRPAQPLPPVAPEPITGVRCPPPPWPGYYESSPPGGWPCEAYPCLPHTACVPAYPCMPWYVPCYGVPVRRAPIYREIQPAAQVVPVSPPEETPAFAPGTVMREVLAQSKPAVPVDLVRKLLPHVKPSMQASVMREVLTQSKPAVPVNLFKKLLAKPQPEGDAGLMRQVLAQSKPAVPVDLVQKLLPHVKPSMQASVMREVLEQQKSAVPVELVQAALPHVTQATRPSIIPGALRALKPKTPRGFTSRLLSTFTRAPAYFATRETLPERKAKLITKARFLGCGCPDGTC